MDIQPSGQSVLDKLHSAQNQHDLESFLSCFAPDYQSEQPAHPDRGFSGREQVRKNWSAIFDSTPDLKSEIRALVRDGDAWWVEWRWYGNRSDGTPFDMRGVTIMGVRSDLISWMRLYMEPVEVRGAGIDAIVQHLTHTPKEGE